MTIKEARSAEERSAVFRLRYDVHERERGRRHQSADHDRGELQDELDGDGVILAAFIEDDARSALTAHGSVRLNWAGKAGFYEDFYRIELAGPWFPAATAVVTQLVVDRAHRNSGLGLRLCVTAFTYAYARGCRFIFVDCNAQHLSWFERLGFRRVLPDAQHSIYGNVHRLVLCLADRQYFRQIGSPFAEALDGLPDDPLPPAHYWRNIAPLMQPMTGAVVDLPRTGRAAPAALVGGAAPSASESSP